jgi:hypothetical protein
MEGRTTPLPLASIKLRRFKTMHFLVAKMRQCCFHETAQNLEISEMARILRCIAEEMQPEYERYSVAFNPCLWLRLQADDLESRR